MIPSRAGRDNCPRATLSSYSALIDQPPLLSSPIPITPSMALTALRALLSPRSLRWYHAGPHRSATPLQGLPPASLDEGELGVSAPGSKPPLSPLGGLCDGNQPPKLCDRKLAEAIAASFSSATPSEEIIAAERTVWMAPAATATAQSPAVTKAPQEQR